MNPEKSDFVIGRHQEAEYKLNERALNSDNPEGKLDPNEQDFISDLTEKGKEEALRQAEEFFSHFDPQKDAFFFASSNFVRAAETANIYRKAAEDRGFEIIAPSNPRDKTVAAVGEGKIMHVPALSLNIENALVDQLFNSKTDYLKLATERGIQFSPEFVARWREARKLIEADNKGNWSDNWRDHSEAVKKIMPEIQTAQELFENQFRKMLRLIEFGRKKIENSEYNKKIRIVAFTHENLFTHWLSEQWGENGLKLGETVSFYYDPKKNLHGVVRGKDQVV